VDARPRVTGELVYGMDFRLPGMLYGKVLRSTEPHAEIVRIDTRKAKALPGVRAVLTAEDIPDVRLPDIVCDVPPLARGKVRYMGEPVALVAAITPEIAEEALRLIEVEYRPLPVILDPEEAMNPDAPLIHEEWESYAAEAGIDRAGNVACHAWLRKGEIERAFAEADYIFEDRFTTRSVHQMHLEPRAAVVSVESGGRVTVYSNTQLPYWIRTNVATVLEVPESQVRVVSLGIGGGFGAKLLPSVEHFCALLSRATGRPVRMATTVREDLTSGYPRHPCAIEIRTAVKADGTILGREARMIMDTGAYAGSGPILTGVATLVLGGPYRIPNLDLHAYAVYTNKMNFGPYRAPSGPQANFALESHMDLIAARLGMDPLEFRLKNIVGEGDEAPNGQVLEAVGLRECLEKVAEAIEWDKPAGLNRGKGLACGWWTTTGGSSGCYAKLQPDGKIVVHVGAPEIGTGAVGQGTVQVWAEAMGVDPEDIVIVAADTDATPYDWGSQGSRTVFNLGNAALRTADDLRRQILEVAAEMLEIDPADLEIADKAVRVKGSPHRKVTLAEVAQKSMYERGGIVARGSYIRPPTPYDESILYSNFYPTFNSPSFFCHAAEVEVDPVTGEVAVLRYVAAHDIGFAINPVGVEGQIHGGIVQGIGMALMEEIIYEDGRVANPCLTDYKVPTIADVPDEVKVILVQRPDRDGPFGAKGVGESPVVPPPATLANAIQRAVGVRIRDLPATPEKILRALEGEGSR
jgi:CO/xanthine dehydrogenase Mo-binding subunit